MDNFVELERLKMKWWRDIWLLASARVMLDLSPMKSAIHTRTLASVINDAKVDLESSIGFMSPLIVCSWTLWWRENLASTGTNSMFYLIDIN